MTVRDRGSRDEIACTRDMIGSSAGDQCTYASYELVSTARTKVQHMTACFDDSRRWHLNVSTVLIQEKVKPSRSSHSLQSACTFVKCGWRLQSPYSFRALGLCSASALVCCTDLTVQPQLVSRPTTSTSVRGRAQIPLFARIVTRFAETNFQRCG